MGNKVHSHDSNCIYSVCKGTTLDCLDNLVGHASSSIPMDPQSPQS